MDSSDNYSSGYDTSNNSSGDDSDVPVQYLPHENRGKKGLTHAEMAQYRADDATASESEEVEEAVEHYEEEDPEEPEPRLRPEEFKVEAVVKTASEILEQNGMETTAIGYARLMGSGKSPIDYIVKLKDITVGRLGFGNDCEIRSDTRYVSRMHARLYWVSQYDRWFIRCYSRKGLVVDGTPIASESHAMPLKSRSLIEIGDVSFFFLLAKGSLFRVNDIAVLEKRILATRAMRDAYSDNPDSDVQYSRWKHDGRSRPSTGRSDRSSGLTLKYKNGVQKSKGSGKKSKSPREEVELSSTDTESEKEEDFVHDVLDDPKYKPMLVPMEERKGKRKHSRDGSQGKRKKRKIRGADSSGEEYEIINGDEEWTKKEKADFARALFTVGVEAVYSSGRLTGFSWERFREIAFLPSKEDYDLEKHYRRFMTDVHTLLEEEEREKRTKGPRTKHKKGCDCIVCVNTAKSRERKRAAQNLEDRIPSDDDDPKATGKPSDKLVGLVTAQKLRVRMGIHEAARQFAQYTPTAQAVIQKLEAQSGRPNDLPQWWKSPYHDKALMKGVARNGVGVWESIWTDEYSRPFSKVVEKEGSTEVFPTPQAAMKRVRDISSMVTSELKKIAKKQRDMQRFARRKERREAKRVEREQRNPRPAEIYEKQPASPRAEADVSTAEESGSEQEQQRQPAADVDTEEEEEDGVEVEVEEMEVEEGDADDIPQGYGHEMERISTERAADDSTDDEAEVEVEEQIQYETASETASE